MYFKSDNCLIFFLSAHKRQKYVAEFNDELYGQGSKFKMLPVKLQGCDLALPGAQLNFCYFRSSAAIHGSTWLRSLFAAGDREAFFF